MITHLSRVTSLSLATVIAFAALDSTASAAPISSSRPVAITAPGTARVVIQSVDSTGGVVIQMEMSGHSYDEAAQAFAGSPSVNVVQDALPNASEGSSDSWHITITLTRTQARALIWGGTGAAAAAIGVATNGIGAVVAAGAFAAMASFASDAFEDCEYVELRMAPVSLEFDAFCISA